ncbi:MAG: ribonuclease R [Bacteroidales bacterium]|nr:ribonuclease R [Bacteroidales bacterium]
MRRNFKKKNSVYSIGRIEFRSSKQIFVTDEQSNEEIKIRKENTLHALDGDRVKVYLLPRRKSKTKRGQVVEILERGRKLFVGVLEKKKNIVFFVPDDRNINVNFVITQKNLSFTDGDKAIAKIKTWQDGYAEPIGEIVKVLGRKGESNVEMESILANNDFSSDFDAEVIKEVDKISFDLDKELSYRRDFRQKMTFTIDPKDAKDFDDALSLCILPNGNREVGVHIADVTYFVKESSLIDKAAYERATSVYLVDRVIPMLPERLCNELCSLRENEVSLTYSVVFEIDSQNEIVSHWIGRTLIHSDRRFRYEEVQKIIEEKQGEKSEYLLPLWEIAQHFRKKRFEHGSVNFESPEYIFDLDENSKPVGIHLKVSEEANWLVEEFMLMANKTVAEEIGKMGKQKEAKTFVYRIHDEPNSDKVDTFKKFASRLGYLIDTSSRSALVRSYNNVFSEVKGKSIETMMSSIALRTMSKACYSCDNIGHYGLAFRYYTHFTSPIRRYPDMMVHRLLTRYLDSKDNSSADKAEYEEYCKHCSDMEKKAAEAERESVKYKQAEFLLDKVGQEFEGEVSGVSKWGVYVLAEENKCEGLVRMTAMKDDFYMLDEDNYQVIGRDFGKTYRLGDKVRVKLIKVDLDKRQIDFILLDD